MTSATTNNTTSTPVASSSPTITSASGSSFSNLQLLQQATNLENPPVLYSSAFISTLQESNNSLFPNSVYTTSTHAHATSSLEFSFRQQTFPGSGQVPVHRNYLSSQINTNFNGNSNDIVNNPVTGDSYHLPYDSVELEKETNYPPGAGKPSPERFCGHQFYCR